MIEIPLHNGLVAVVWNRDAYLTQYRWTALEGEHTWYAIRGERGKSILMHRQIMAFPDQTVDHRNNDGLDNRRSNLRLATQSQNSMNRRLQANNTSGVKGVDWHKGQWRVRMKVQGRRFELGHYNTLEEATAVRLAGEIEYYGEFRR